MYYALKHHVAPRVTFLPQRQVGGKRFFCCRSPIKFVAREATVLPAQQRRRATKLRSPVEVCTTLSETESDSIFSKIELEQAVNFQNTCLSPKYT
jgi:hypothetical protein